MNRTNQSSTKSFRFFPGTIEAVSFVDFQSKSNTVAFQKFEHTLIFHLKCMTVGSTLTGVMI